MFQEKLHKVNQT